MKEMGSSVCKENTKQLSETWGKRQRIEIIMTKMCKETNQHDSDRQKEVWGGHIQHWKWARIQITLLNLHFQDERMPSCADAIKPEHRQWTHNKAKRQTKNNQKMFSNRLWNLLAYIRMHQPHAYCKRIRNLYGRMGLHRTDRTKNYF